MGVAGLVEELGKEGPRELLGCEWVLEEQGLIKLAPIFQVFFLSLKFPKPPPPPPPRLLPAEASQLWASSWGSWLEPA